MKRFLAEHPWVWVIGLIVLVLGFEGIFFYVASSTAGPEFEPLEAVEQAAQPSSGEETGPPAG